MLHWIFAALPVATGINPDDVIIPPVYETAVGMPCMVESDCRIFPEDPHCDPELGECVECFAPEHCDPGWECSPVGSCVDICRTNADCDGTGGYDLCNREGYCVACLGNEDCAREEFCAVVLGECRPDACVPGEQTCQFDTILECISQDGTQDVVEVCDAGCEMTDAGPQCAGADDTGNSSDTQDTAPGVRTTGVPPDPPQGDDTGVATSDSAETTAGNALPEPTGCTCNSTTPVGVPWLLALVGLMRRRKKNGARRGC